MWFCVISSSKVHDFRSPHTLRIERKGGQYILISIYTYLSGWFSWTIYIVSEILLCMVWAQQNCLSFVQLPILRFLTSPSTSCCIVPPKIALSRGWLWLVVSWRFDKVVGRRASIKWETVADISCVVVAHTVVVDLVVPDDDWSGMEITGCSLSLFWNQTNF